MPSVLISERNFKSIYRGTIAFFYYTLTCIVKKERSIGEYECTPSPTSRDKRSKKSSILRLLNQIFDKISPRICITEKISRFEAHFGFSLFYAAQTLNVVIALFLL